MQFRSGEETSAEAEKMVAGLERERVGLPGHVPIIEQICEPRWQW